MAGPWEKYQSAETPAKKPWESDIFNDFAGQAAKLDPTDLAIARSKNDAFGDYLRGQAMAPRVESQQRRDERLYGAPLADNQTSKLVSGAAGVVDTGMLGFGDEAMAGMRSLGSGRPYDQELNYTRQGMQKFQADNPGTYLAGQVGGGVSQGLTTGPITGAGRLVNPAMTGGKALGARMGVAGAEGLAQGAIYGFGSGQDTVANRAQSALESGAIGGVTGAAAPLVASGFRNTGEWAANKFANSDAISGISSAAQKYLVNNLADPQALTSMRGQLAQLGPDATMADVSEEWLGVARGAAARPDTRSMVVNPLNARSANANMRLNADLDANLGRAVIPSQVDATLAAGQDVIEQRYPEVMRGARAVNTEPLANTLESSSANLRGPELRAVQDVRRMLNINNTDQLDPNPQALLATRRAIDGMFTTETNPSVIRQLTMARNQVDDELARAVPQIKEVDAPFAELARQREALTQGRPILNNEASAMRPQELQTMLTEGGLPQGQMIGPSGASTRARQGVRAEIDRAMGTKANDVTAVKNIVRGEGDWNREKLGLMFGQDRADNALSALDREVKFGDTANRVTRGSDTAMAGQFAEFLNRIEGAANVPTDSTLTGYGVKAAKAIASALMRQNAGQKASKYAADIGNLSVAQGAQRDAIMDSLLKRGTRNIEFNSLPQKQKTDAIAKALMVGGALPMYQNNQ